MPLKLIQISEEDLVQTLDSMHLEPQIKELVDALLFKCQYRITTLIVDIFTMYCSSYTLFNNCIFNDYIVSISSARLDKIASIVPNYDVEKLLVASKHDIVRNHKLNKRLNRFNSYFYCDLHEVISLVRSEDVKERDIRNLFKTVEYLFDSVESNILHFTSEIKEDYFTVYLDIVKNKLYVLLEY